MQILPKEAGSLGIFGLEFSSILCYGGGSPTCYLIFYLKHTLCLTLLPCRSLERGVEIEAMTLQAFEFILLRWSAFLCLFVCYTNLQFLFRFLMKFSSNTIDHTRKTIHVGGGCNWPWGKSPKICAIHANINSRVTSGTSDRFWS